MLVGMAVEDVRDIALARRLRTQGVLLHLPAQMEYDNFAHPSLAAAILLGLLRDGAIEALRAVEALRPDGAPASVGRGLRPGATPATVTAMSDEIFEHETTETMTREQAAARLRELADQLSRQNEVRIEHAGRDVVVTVPDQVELEVELEIEEGGESELEISLSW